jgi:hypothetical protein
MGCTDTSPNERGLTGGYVLIMPFPRGFINDPGDILLP